MIREWDLDLREFLDLTKWYAALPCGIQTLFDTYPAGSEWTLFGDANLDIYIPDGWRSDGLLDMTIVVAGCELAVFHVQGIDPRLLIPVVRQ